MTIKYIIDGGNKFIAYSNKLWAILKTDTTNEKQLIDFFIFTNNTNNLRTKENGE
jgi:hypothetical protein